MHVYHLLWWYNVPMCVLNSGMQLEVYGTYIGDAVRWLNLEPSNTPLASLWCGAIDQWNQYQLVGIHCVHVAGTATHYFCQLGKYQLQSIYYIIIFILFQQ